MAKNDPKAPGDKPKRTAAPDTKVFIFLKDGTPKDAVEFVTTSKDAMVDYMVKRNEAKQPVGPLCTHVVKRNRQTPSA